MSVSIPKTKSASDESIAELEGYLGKKLPSMYIDFVRNHNGARPAPNVFNVGVKNSASVDEFIPVSEDKRIREVVEGFPQNALAIARASGGNFVYIEPATGAVYFRDHEVEEADTKLADSLDEFIANLQPCEINRVKLKPGQAKRISGNQDFKPEF